MGGALLLAALAKVAERTERLPECAGVYALIVLAAGWLSPVTAIERMMMNASAAFFGAWLLFALLTRFQDKLVLWVIALFVGLLAMYAIQRTLMVALLPF